MTFDCKNGSGIRCDLSATSIVHNVSWKPLRRRSSCNSHPKAQSIEQQTPNRIVNPFESEKSAANDSSWVPQSSETVVVPKEVIDPFGNGLEVIELDSFEDFVAATGGAKPEAMTQEKWAEMLESLANE